MDILGKKYIAKKQYYSYYKEGRLILGTRVTPFATPRFGQLPQFV